MFNVLLIHSKVKEGTNVKMVVIKVTYQAAHLHI